MNANSAIIIGAGGHASVVADALIASGISVLGFVDNDVTRHGKQLCGLPVLGGDDALAGFDASLVGLVNGIGGTKGEGRRSEVQKKLEALGWHFLSVRHPSAMVSSYAQLGHGIQLMANCVVQPGAKVSAGCIVNTAAVVEHDVELGQFVHVATNATLCGGVKVGAHSHIGAAAVILQGLVLGESTVVGAGAVVTNPYEGRQTLVGVPAHPVKSRSS
jgi:sugar O-acyltransferase (sialic acid O-acetyltransferase NeuD family)